MVKNVVKKYHKRTEKKETIKRCKTGNYHNKAIQFAVYKVLFTPTKK